MYVRHFYAKKTLRLGLQGMRNKTFLLKLTFKNFDRFEQNWLHFVSMSGLFETVLWKKWFELNILEPETGLKDHFLQALF